MNIIKIQLEQKIECDRVIKVHYSKKQLIFLLTDLYIYIYNFPKFKLIYESEEYFDPDFCNKNKKMEIFYFYMEKFIQK